MIIVVDDETNVGDLHKALRRGGFVLRAKPKGIFELIKVNGGKPTCEEASCRSIAAVRDEASNLCARHWAEVHGG